MRAYITPLVAVVALFASSGVASAVTASTPVKLAQLYPGSTNNVQTENNGARFLRKRVEAESDDLSSEERGGLADVAKKAKQYLTGETRLAKLFTKTDDQLFLKKIGPDDLTNAANRLEKRGWSKETVEEFKAIAARYSDYWYRNLPDPV
ncbi:hypothetical protein PHYPSEUDO_008434 [Phytophthora pseudosyringae]|uniref:RxLR effector protein n=1 Tax=Phytophthora pseudosyringae TaxID=221518 RepID=A0A8T1VHF1_9STRA|nr:hypothetical protein PHYPSEUDO_008434 [Phytophthora pseudosyringae]